MEKTVLVTRPLPAATRTADRLRAQGYVPLLLPLTEIVPLNPASPEGTFNALVATSANALAHASDALLAPYLQLPCFTVGEATADAARARGFETVTTGDGDGESLAQTIVEELCSGASILYLTGRVRSPGFERAVAKAGFPCASLAVYDTISVSYTTEFLIKTLGSRNIDYCLLYSQMSSDVLSTLIKAARLAELFDKTLFLCLSRRIADGLKGLNAPSIGIARRPDEDALFDLLAGLQGDG
ncbi:uroporphyrinogen-III synthase [Phyllobacterium myrsinacearum]|uniref:Uroporphyrinogen-III synthase n=1 Tax=Phyllobacterium myrsinacearum TaxID=28101 RepID=A0A2S9JJF8_9HYPH|nr:uroporphyrinogen-III synthase [Phyllobacterium myrsinacearum]PRD53241.1 uroporphyrinogen III synthase [Phyllobacterium myrsinacearum]PWV93899.1 uroporphyrinogen-III synthase [Phyllobacterium myrsinacearum]RZV07662.1 uroporphyrinogen-III synthase [Phyllobacterium myrsinacearum]